MTGCSAAGAPTNATPGGPAPVISFNECFANVIVTNTYYVAPATTAAPAAPAAAAPAVAAPATTAAPAPAPTPAPATPVVDEPTFTG